MLSSKQWNNKASDIKLVYLYSTNKFRYSTINNEVAKAGQGNWKLFSGPSVHTSRIVVAKVKAKFVLYSVPHRNAKQGRKFGFPIRPFWRFDNAYLYSTSCPNIYRIKTSFAVRSPHFLLRATKQRRFNYGTWFIRCFIYPQF